MKRLIAVSTTLVAVILMMASASLWAQQATPRPSMISSKPPAQPPPAPVPNYVIGPSDVLTIAIWNEEKISGDVTVRPDGKITMRIGSDIVASGLTTDELKEKVNVELRKFYQEPIPAVTIQVKTINSRYVGITGAVNKPGQYPLMGPVTVLQLITMAGGLQEFADRKNIMLVSGTLKNKDGSPLSYKINYDDLVKGKNLAKYNIELRPGDTIIVP